MVGGVSNITDTKDAEAARLESEHQLRTLVENLPGVVYRCSLEAPWRLSFISEAVGRLTGYPAHEFLSGGRNWEQVIHADDRDMVGRVVGESVRNGEPFDLKYRVVLASGEVRWVRENGTAIMNGKGEPAFLQGFIGDVHNEVIAGERLRQTEERYRLASRATRDLIWDWDLQSDQLTWNEALGSRMGYGQDELGSSGKWWLDHIHPHDRERVSREVENIFESGGTQYFGGYRFRRADGSYAETFDRGYVIRDADGQAVRMVGAMQDLTEQHRASVALRESEALNHSIVEASADCIKLFDLEGRLLFMNGPGACALGIEDPTTLYGTKWEDLWPQESRSLARQALATARQGGVGRFSADCSTAKGGKKGWDVVVSPVNDDQGTPVKLVCISRDITERRAAEKQLIWSATHDSLTGLANRTLFQERLARAIEAGAASGHKVGMLLLDLDGFKQINDTLGHDAGDVLLNAFGERLQEAVPGNDLVARLGGDEFAVVMEDLVGTDAVEARCNEILSHLAEPFVHAGHLLDFRASVGASLFPQHGTTPRELLKNADLALYVAKAAGGGLTIFDPVHRAEFQKRSSMVTIARSIVREDRIVPHYQPKFCLRSGKIAGFEALLRWRDANNRIQLPGRIAAAFEDYEVALSISERILELVVADMQHWHDRGIPFGHVAVNASATEFRRDNFAENVLERLARAKLPASCLQLEVTETVFLGRGAEYVDRALKLLSREGVSIALDDFGTGYASLRHLKQFPVDVIKVDQSFVRDMERDPNDAAIIEAVLNLGKSLGIEVVAEGIETEAQAAHLATVGCDIGQGFLFAPALPAAEALWLLHQRPNEAWERRRA
jgi:diguanylate cyclase (GGDEF)-like protein/PAS domain S-box-containing protein